MNFPRAGCCGAIACAGLLVAGCSGPSPSVPADASAAAAAASARPAVSAASAAGRHPAHAGTVADAGISTGVFQPPPESSIPDSPFGAMVRKGQAIFVRTQANARGYVGNGLNCVNCHLDAGRLANSAPLWAAWVRYPAYRAKNGHVNTFAERLQGCFRFSMDGKAPPADSDIIVALETYSYWLASGAPTGEKMPGAGYPELKPPARTPSYARGKEVYARECALCHGDDGQGQEVAGAYVFPPLWGPHSYNWGAGMARVNTAAGFIQANMPFSLGGTLGDGDAWDVAWYMDAHERPQDPRFTGNVAATRKQFHDNQWSLYGMDVEGRLLGSGEPAKRR